MSIEKYIKNNKSKFDDLKMSSEVDKLFEKRLQEELHNKKTYSKNYWFVGIAASVAVLVFFVLSFNSEDSETLKLKKELVAKLSDESAGKQLEGIYQFSDDYKKEDKQIIKILVKTLFESENINVRIASIDALLEFPDNQYIRENLIKALEQEEKPLVQIKLIKSLKILREKRAKKVLKKVIEDDKNLPIVKNNATLAINTINE